MESLSTKKSKCSRAPASWTDLKTTRRPSNTRLTSSLKTGTTSDYHDVWFIGFTHDLVAGVCLTLLAGYTLIAITVMKLARRLGAPA